MTFYKSYSNSMDKYVSASDIGAPTNPTVAKQLTEFGNMLNQGIKNIEIGVLDPSKFEAIPEAHFGEIKRLAKLTGAKPSLHGPLIELSGFPSKQGEKTWTEEQRQTNEQQMFSVLERANKISNGENIPVVFHAGQFTTQEYGKPWDGTPGDKGLKVWDQKEKKFVPGKFRMLMGINRNTGEMAPMEYEERYRIGTAEKDIYDPFRRISNINQTQWDEDKLKILKHQKDIEEIREKTLLKQKQNDAIMKSGLRAKEEYQKVFYANEKDLLLAQRHIEELNQRLASDYENVYDKFKRFASENDQQRFRERIENMNKQYQEAIKDLSKTGKETEEIYKEMVSAQTDEEYLEKARKYKEQEQEILNKRLNLSKFVVTNVADLPTPEIWVPAKDFAVEKTAETVSNAVARLYKKVKDEGNGEEKKIPFVALENFFIDAPMSRGGELRKGVMECRKRLAEKLQNECDLSKTEAEREAEKLVGATWDVGHINNLRKAGFEGEELKKEILDDTKKVADVVKHFHITDNFGFFDSHLAPGMGNAPIPEIMEELEKTWERQRKEGTLTQDPRRIIEAGGVVAELGVNPTVGILEYFGSPLYKMGDNGYFWGAQDPQRRVASTYPTYHETFTEFPQQHFNLYGASFTTLPKTLGGQVGGETSRFSGTPNQ